MAAKQLIGPAIQKGFQFINNWTQTRKQKK